SYVWDYNNQHVIAQCTNAGVNDIAYTSFETPAKGYFNFTGAGAIGNSFTGSRYFQLTGANSIVKSNLNPAMNYIVSYWSKNGPYTISGSNGMVTGKTIDGWTYYEHTVGNSSSVSINGVGSIDELRFYPRNALMQTYVYDPFLGLTASCDVNNHVSKYEYDPIARLKTIRDENSNILKHYDYKLCYDVSNIANTAPNWQNTANTRCKACPVNAAFISNILQQEQIDINQQSITYNQLRWIDIGPSPACDVNAVWQNVEPAEYRCVLSDLGVVTGEQEQKQQDVNPCSVTYLQFRWIDIGLNLGDCPLLASCTDCIGPDKKCINDNCETAIKVYTSSVFNPKGGFWVCSFYYLWSDGSHSGILTEISSSDCKVDDHD
ncbi:MAG TPA: hypothetical protein VKH37_13160, partial [Ferruginibacter sp.]|nr:hypothetical protein [Ferruginibacter sp.]